MSGDIKTLADELREHIRQDAAGPRATIKTKHKNRSSPGVELDLLFDSLATHQLGSEVINVRLDPKVTALLRQLKIHKGIDMNKFISYAVQDFLKRNPGLITFIKDSLNNLDL